jgi:hypothetical protein
MKRVVIILGLSFSTIAMAAREVDASYMSRVTIDKPACSGDTECTKAMEKMKRTARSKANIEAKGFANNLCKQLGHHRGELKYFSIRDNDLLNKGHAIEFIMSGTVYARCFND